MSKLVISIGAIAAGCLLGSGVWSIQQRGSRVSALMAQPSRPAAVGKDSAQIPGAIVANAAHAPLLAAAWAGKRIVAVGEHGVILLSDDAGYRFRQAHSVPSQAMLTCVSFVDARQGWAAGHDGLVLHTTDGGETWTIQREDLDGDKPLFSIFFRDTRHGLAVGLFGTAVQTSDGGKTWGPLTVESGEEADHHLYAIFGASDSGLFIAGEGGLIYRSTDGGKSWTTIKTPSPGSLWTGILLRDGRLLAAGQRGHIVLSHDGGESWADVASSTEESLTGIAQNADGSLIVTGLAGTLLHSGDDGKTFTVTSRGDRMSLNAVLSLPDGGPILFGGTGIVTGPSRQSAAAGPS